MATKTKAGMEERVKELTAEGLGSRRIAAQLEAENYGVVSKTKVNEIQKAIGADVAPENKARIAGQAPAALGDAHLLTVDPSLIDDNPWQPRTHRTPAKENELLESIANDGLIQRPIARTLLGGRYQVIAGHRRLDAMTELVARKDPRWPHSGVLVEVRQVSDEQAAAIALQENTAREDLTQMEKVRAWKRMMDEIPGMTQDRIAQIAGLGDRSTVANYLRLLQLPQFILDLVDLDDEGKPAEKGQMSPRAAREFLALHDTAGAPHPQVEMMQHVVEQIRKAAWRNYGPEVKPNFSVKSVRFQIAHTVQHAGQGAADHFGDGQDRKWQWRPIDKGGFQSGNDRSGDWPHDTEAFAQAYPDTIYRIPIPDSDGSRRWTSDAVEWQKWRDRAAAAVKKATPAGESFGRASSGTKAQAHPPAASKHPLVAAKAKEAKGSIPWGELGTLAQPVLEFDTYGSGTRKVVARLQPLQKGEGQDRDVPKLPPWFDDSEECTKRCMIGARFAQQRYSNKGVELVCTNADHFKQKLNASRAKVEPHVKAQVKQEELTRGLLVDSLMAVVPAGPQGATMAALMLRGVYGLTRRRPWGHAGYEDFAYTPKNTVRIAEIAGVQLRDGSLSRSGDTRMFDAVHEDVAQELVARVTVAVLEELEGMAGLKALAEKLGVAQGTEVKRTESGGSGLRLALVNPPGAGASYVNLDPQWVENIEQADDGTARVWWRENGQLNVSVVDRSSADLLRQAMGVEG